MSIIISLMFILQIVIFALLVRGIMKNKPKQIVMPQREEKSDNVEFILPL